MSTSQVKRSLAPTLAIVGDYRCVDTLQGNPADMGMIQQIREVLGHKTNITALEWWKLFPSRKWWSYAIKCTKYLCKAPNYKYFLRCLLTAATDQERVKQTEARLKGAVIKDELVIESQKPTPPVCNCAGGCEKCETSRQAYYRAQFTWRAKKWGGDGDHTA